MNSHRHITHGYDRQLDSLLTTLQEMSGMVNEQVELSLRAVQAFDPEMVKEAKKRDREINALEERIENQVTHLLTTQMPMAQDLRAVLSALRIAAELERAGDHAKNIVKRCRRLEAAIPAEVVEKFAAMEQEVVMVLTRAMQAFLSGDTEQAVDVWKSDDGIDTQYRALFRRLLDGVREFPEQAETYTHVIFIAKFYERIADYANEIAKTVHYVASGTRPRNL